MAGQRNCHFRLGRFAATLGTNDAPADRTSRCAFRHLGRLVPAHQVRARGPQRAGDRVRAHGARGARAGDRDARHHAGRARRHAAATGLGDRARLRLGRDSVHVHHAWRARGPVGPDGGADLSRRAVRRPARAADRPVRADRPAAGSRHGDRSGGRGAGRRRRVDPLARTVRGRARDGRRGALLRARRLRGQAPVRAADVDADVVRLALGRVDRDAARRARHGAERRAGPARAALRWSRSAWSGRRSRS